MAKPFDPKAYLSEEKKGFDPKSYLGGVDERTSYADMVADEPSDISALNRFAVKNLSNNPQDAAEWIARRQPELDVTVKDGEIVARKKGVPEQYKRLDPSSLELADVGDVAYDALSGAGQTVAAGSGLAAGPAGAVFAGGASGAGLEGLRQALGQYLGINKNVDMKDVGVAGTIGAVTPGAGKVVNAGLKSAGRFVGDKVLPSVTSVASGIPKQTIKNLKKLYPELTNLESGGVLDPLEQIHSKLKSALYAGKSQAGKEMGEGLASSDAKISLESVRRPIENLKQEYIALKDAGLSTSAVESKIANINEQVNQIFGTGKVIDTGILDEAGEKIIRNVEPPTDVSPLAAAELSSQLGDLADVNKIGTGLVSRHGKSDVFDKRLSDTALSSKRAIEESLDNSIEGRPEAKAAYAKFAQIQKALNGPFSSTDRTASTLRNWDSKNKDVTRETIMRLEKSLADSGLPQTNLIDDARLFNVYNTFSKPSLDAVSSGGSTSTSRSIPAAALGASIGSAIGWKTGGGVASGLGAGIGAMAGAKAASPSAIRKMVELDMKLGMKYPELVKKYGNALTGATSSTWNRMYSDEQQGNQ